MFNISTFQRIVCVATIILGISACVNPSTVEVPNNILKSEKNLSDNKNNLIPVTTFTVRAGDTLRIVRDAQPPSLVESSTLYVVNDNGKLNYPYAGTIDVSGKSLAEISTDISNKLSKTYREPQVTINIVSSPGNRYFIGGDVRVPDVYPLQTSTSIDQAILQAGGVLSSADSKNIALLRLDQKNEYQVFFYDFTNLLGKGESQQVYLQRGDMIYVPKSGIGKAIENVDMYLNKLIPFTKGIGFNYELQQDR